MREIKLRASNPDNIFDIKGIIDLFFLSYSDTFPNHEVYNECFWSERIGNRFISIIAEENGKIIGHIACCPQKEDKKNIQIIMPVVIPCDYEQEILDLLWKKVECLAQKKSWKVAFKFITSYPEKMENTISMIGNFYETAVYPGHKDEQSIEDIHVETSFPVLYSQHTFNTNLIKKETVFVPSQYKSIIKKFYDDLSIPRQILSEKNQKIIKFFDNEKPVEVKSYRHTGLCRLYITPSLLDDFSPSILSFDNNRFLDLLLYVNLLDPKTPSFCEFLENEGYSFCGIIPLIDNSDFILYTKNLNNLKECHFVKESGEILREIILQNENNKNISPSFPREDIATFL